MRSTVFGVARVAMRCADGVVTRPGDQCEIEADAFWLGLRNPLARAETGVEGNRAATVGSV